MRNLSRATIIVLGWWAGCSLFLTFPIQAVATNLVITEIMYDLEGSDDPHEWIEIYNRGNQNLTLIGRRGSGSWRFYDGSNHLLNIETLAISPGQYIILANDLQTFLIDHPGFSGIVIDTVMSLRNTSATLKLIDGEGNEVTSVTYQNSWGANGNGKSLEKIDSAGADDLSNWGESLIIGGTPGRINSISGIQKSPQPEEPIIEPQPEPEIPQEEPQQEPQPKPEKLKPITYPSGIIINELLPDPKDIPDAEGEYIEIFNKNEEKTNLSGWKIADAVGKEAKIYTFPEETIIEGEEFLVFYRSTTKIILNNDGDNISLIQPGGKVVDSVAYENAPKGESYNRIPSGWAWSTILTPGRENNILIQETEESEFVEEAAKIDINTAPLKDLVKIVHIGEAKAQELISLRPFYSLDELIRIKGISDEALEDIKTQGLAWVDPILEPPKIEKGTEPIEKGLAAVAEPFKPFEKPIPKSLSIFLIALALAIFSGIIILILKRKTY